MSIIVVLHFFTSLACAIFSVVTHIFFTGFYFIITVVYFLRLALFVMTLNKSWIQASSKGRHVHTYLNSTETISLYGSFYYFIVEILPLHAKFTAALSCFWGKVNSWSKLWCLSCGKALWTETKWYWSL